MNPSVSTASRIASLRASMQRHGLSAWIVPSSDPHLSEYLPERWQGRQWMSGFTGSVGTLVVTARFAGVWVDSRYWLQAEAELDGTGIAPMKVSSNAGVAFIDWLAANCGQGDTVGADGRVLGLATVRALQDALAGCGASLRLDLDLLDEVWPDRPGLPLAPVFEQQQRFAPVARLAKLKALREAMQRAGAGWHLISSLDDIAWVLNVRGSDVSFNPVFLAHLLGRQVDRHAHAQPFVAPHACLAAGVLDDPAAERADQTEALGDRNEGARRDQTARRMLPA